CLPGLLSFPTRRSSDLLSYLGLLLIFEQKKLRGQDLNLRPSGYEPDELPDCSTPRYYIIIITLKCFVNKHFKWAKVDSNHRRQRSEEHTSELQSRFDLV